MESNSDLFGIRELMKELIEDINKQQGIERLDITLNPFTRTEDLDMLSTRLRNFLLKNNINTVMEIQHTRDGDLLSLGGFGDKLCRELNKFTYQYNLR